MISRFHVKNFRSIVDLDISFRYGEGKAPGGYRDMQMMPFLEDKTGRYVPCLAIYGPNAGGKSNIVEAMSFLLALMSGMRANVCSFIYNKLHPEMKETVLEIEWSDGGDLFFYSLTCNGSGMIAEDFSVNKILRYRIENALPYFDELVRPEYPVEKLKNIFDVECTTTEPRSQITAFLPKLVHNLPGLQPDLTRAFIALQQLNVYQSENCPAWLAFNVLEKAANETNQATLRARVFELVQRFDLGIKEIKYQREFKETNEQKQSWSNPWSSVRVGDKIQQDTISTVHTDINGNSVTFDIEEESLGTRQLISLFCLIVATLETGRTLVIDEIDRSLHPLVLREIVRLFKSREHNSTRAQLIFTTHTPDLLEGNLLRMSEVAIVEKTLAQGTKIKRLSDYKDLRNALDFRKRYLDGEFRGIPYPYI